MVSNKALLGPLKTSFYSCSITLLGHYLILFSHVDVGYRNRSFKKKNTVK